MLGSTVVAYNFLLDGNVVGVVDLLNRKGAVVLANTIPDDLQFVLVNVTAALLVRQNLDDSLFQ